MAGAAGAVSGPLSQAWCPPSQDPLWGRVRFLCVSQLRADTHGGEVYGRAGPGSWRAWESGREGADPLLVLWWLWPGRWHVGQGREARRAAQGRVGLGLRPPSRWPCQAPEEMSGSLSGVETGRGRAAGARPRWVHVWGGRPLWELHSGQESWVWDCSLPLSPAPSLWGGHDPGRQVRGS